VAGTFAVDPDTATVADIRRSAEAIMERYERHEEQRLVSEIFEAVAEGRPAAIGLEACLWAGSVAAVQHLVIDEGAAVPGVVCDESGCPALAAKKPSRFSRQRRLGQRPAATRTRSGHMPRPVARRPRVRPVKLAAAASAPDPMGSSMVFCSADGP
jgi:hypothetical protein